MAANSEVFAFSVPLPCNSSPCICRSPSCSGRFSFETRLSQLLKSNEAPSSDEETSYRSIVSDCTNEIADLDKKIAEMKLLISQRNLYVSKLHNHKAVLNPVRRLVNDVLYEIFRRYVHAGLGQSHDGGQSKGMWLISTVCRSWRDAAFSFPTLWTSVDVSFDRIPRTNGPVYMLLRQLKYCGDAPMDVTLRSSTPIPLTQPLLPIILSSSAQWHRLTLSIPASSYVYLTQVKNFLGSLKYLQVRHVDGDGRAQAVDIFAFASKLTSIKSIGCKGIQPLIKLPNIEEYSATDLLGQSAWSIDEHLAMLSQMPGLRRCHLDCRSPMARAPHPTFFQRQITTLRTLQDLSIHCHDEVALMSFLSEVTVPNLTKLTISGPVGLQHDILRTFLARSQCSVTVLILQISVKSAQILPSFVQLFNDLEELEIRHSSSSLTLLSSDELLTQLCCKPSSECILPKLKVLSLECSVDARLLIKTIETRWKKADECHASLKEVNVYSHISIDPQISAEMDHFRQNGFIFRECYEKGAILKGPRKNFE